MAKDSQKDTSCHLLFRESAMFIRILSLQFSHKPTSSPQFGVDADRIAMLVCESSATVDPMTHHLVVIRVLGSDMSLRKANLRGPMASF